MANRELTREVQGERCRQGWVAAPRAVLIAITLPSLAAALLASSRPPAVHTVEVRTTRTELVAVPQVLAIPQVLAVPTAVPASSAPAARATCPPPRRDAPRITPGELPEEITHVRPSPTNAGWIAAWNAAHVFVSTDAGASWHRQLDGDGAVQDVAFDCFGRTIAIRGDRVGIRDGAVERWRRPPGVQMASTHTADGDVAAYADGRVLGGGPDVVVLANGPDDQRRGVLVRSFDLGVTWQRYDVSEAWDTGRVVGRQHEDGTIRGMLAIADCMSDSPLLFEITDRGLRTEYAVVGDQLQLFGELVVGYRGWQRFGGEPHPFDELPDYPEILEGPYPIARVGDQAFRIRGSKATRLPWKIAGELAVVDPAGRIWSVHCGSPRIATRALPDATCAD